ncbi:unnamed protein product [Gongylonema pulchrum]|uniref:BZIP domain-containing protein n=1 Tax=Gongylonema pulchrum TaxID=637853 RepID=A0A183DRN4_9BILA|nr:unnamed protein product [Gongylonema pulchrum]
MRHRGECNGRQSKTISEVQNVVAGSSKPALISVDFFRRGFLVSSEDCQREAADALPNSLYQALPGKYLEDLRFFYFFQLEQADRDFFHPESLWEATQESGSLLSDCFIGYDTNSVLDAHSRRPSFDFEWSPEQVLHVDDDEKDSSSDISKWSFSYDTMPNDDARVSNKLDGESEATEPSWLEQFMHVYGVSDFIKNDDFSMESCTDALVIAPRQDVGMVPMHSEEEVESSEIFNEKEDLLQPPVCNSSSFESEDGRIGAKNIGNDKGRKKKRKSESKPFSGDTAACKTMRLAELDSGRVYDTAGSSSGNLRKFWSMALPACSDRRKERVREQNRNAAIRYRDKRRQKAKQKKEELHELELRNVQLKTEQIWLEKEVTYLKNLMALLKNA